MSDSLLDLEHQRSQEKLGALSRRTEEMLRAASRWTTFLGIMGFIGTGFCALAAVFVWFLYLRFKYMNQFVPVVYLVASVSMFFPSLYQIRFSRQLKDAFAHRTEYSFEDAMETLRNYFRFRGIYVICVVGLYILIMLFTILGLSFGSPAVI